MNLFLYTVQYKMPPHVRVSDETRARIDRAEMDSQLERLRGHFAPRGPDPLRGAVEAPGGRGAGTPVRGLRRPLRIETYNIRQDNFICKDRIAG